MASMTDRPYFTEFLDEIGRNLLNNTLNKINLLHITRKLPLNILFNFQYNFNYYIRRSYRFNSDEKKTILQFMQSVGGQRLLMDIYSYASRRIYVKERIRFVIKDGLDDDDVKILKREYETYDTYDLLQVIIHSNNMGKEAIEDSESYIEKIKPEYILRKEEYEKKRSEYEFTSEEEKESKYKELKELDDKLQEIYEKSFDPGDISDIIQEIQSIVYGVFRDRLQGDTVNIGLMRELNEYRNMYSKLPNGAYIKYIIDNHILYGSSLPAYKDRPKSETLSSRKYHKRTNKTNKTRKAAKHRKQK